MCGDSLSQAVTSALGETGLKDREVNEVRALTRALCASVGFKGAGHGAQECRLELVAPALVARTGGAMEPRRFIASVVPDSDL